MKEQETNVKSWEASRKNLIDEQKVKRESERTHRAALYVTCALYRSNRLTSIAPYQVC
jgi:hypothetical protein